MTRINETRLHNLINDYEQMLNNEEYGFNAILNSNNHNLFRINPIWENRLMGFLTKYKQDIIVFCEENNIKYTYNFAFLHEFNLKEFNDIVIKGIKDYLHINKS